MRDADELRGIAKVLDDDGGWPIAALNLRAIAERLENTTKELVRARESVSQLHERTTRAEAVADSTTNVHREGPGRTDAEILAMLRELSDAISSFEAWNPDPSFGIPLWPWVPRHGDVPPMTLTEWQALGEEAWTKRVEGELVRIVRKWLK